MRKHLCGQNMATACQKESLCRSGLRHIHTHSGYPCYVDIPQRKWRFYTMTSQCHTGAGSRTLPPWKQSGNMECSSAAQQPSEAGITIKDGICVSYPCFSFCIIPQIDFFMSAVPEHVFKATEKIHTDQIFHSTTHRNICKHTVEYAK